MSFSKYLSLLPLMSSAEHETCELFYNYLIDAGVNKKDIEMLYISKGLLSLYNHLPSSLWDNSILKPYTYYYHNELVSKSKPTFFNFKTNAFVSPTVFYYEPKIIYTTEEAILYLYKQIKQPETLNALKRDSKALEHILSNPSSIVINTIHFQAIDVLMSFFDFLSLKNKLYGSLFDLYNNHYASFLHYADSLFISPMKDITIRTGENVCTK